MRIFWQGREDSVSSLRRKAEFLISALLRSSVFRGSDSPPDCHSLPLPFESSQNCIPAKRKSPQKNRGLYLFGRGGRTRTRDPRFWRPVLYQLSYTPVHLTIIPHSFYFCKSFFKKTLFYFEISFHIFSFILFLLIFFSFYAIIPLIK